MYWAPGRKEKREKPILPHISVCTQKDFSQHVKKLHNVWKNEVFSIAEAQMYTLTLNL